MWQTQLIGGKRQILAKGGDNCKFDFLTQKHTI
jgi:hypothetical protein